MKEARAMASSMGYGRLLAGAECPGVDQLDTTALIVAGIAGCHRGLAGAGNRGSLAVELADWPARSAAFSSDGGVRPSRRAIKRQDAVAEILFEQAFDCGACPREGWPRRAAVLLRQPW